MINALTNLSEKVKCYVCKGTYPRLQTLIVQTKKGKFRVCRDCYSRYQADKMNEDYQETKDNIKKFNLKGVDPYQLIKEKEEFMKKIKGGL